MIRTALLAACLAGAAAAQPAEPDGYRTGDYRAPTPATLRGATVVSTDAAHALWLTGQVGFVDVLPRAPKPEKLPEGTVWHEKARQSIPGAIWLANAGYGDLAPVMEDYFRTGVARVTAGDPDAPVLFFCLRDCWMSWNAARRAVADGHTRVFWYPDGTDGWTEAGLPTERVEPEPGGK